MITSKANLRGKGRFDRDKIDVAVLLAAFVVGIAASIGMKVLDWPIWMPLLSSAVVIIGYAIITYTTARARLEPDQIGDNAYYLGFVFTLTALGYTIYEIDLNGGAESLRKVISGFGVALSSTVVGVVTRVILLQYRIDLTAREGEIRIQLNDAAREFHIELADATRSTKLLGTEILQNLEEHHKEVSAAYEKRTAAIFDELIGSFKHACQQVVEQGTEMNMRLADSATKAISNGEQAADHSFKSVGRSVKTTIVTFKSEIEALSEASRQAIEASRSSHMQNIAHHNQMMQESSDAMVTSSKGLKTAMEQLGVQSREMANTMTHTQSETAQRYDLAMRDSIEQLSAATGSFAETVSACLADFEKQAAIAAKFNAAQLKRQRRWSIWTKP